MLKRFEKKIYRIVASRSRCYYSGSPFRDGVTNRDYVLTKQDMLVFEYLNFNVLVSDMPGTCICFSNSML
jgi:hypothetical protein